MRKLFAICLLLFLSSCGSSSKGIAEITGYSNVCIDGVHYLQFPSGVTPKYSRSGNILNCNF